MRSLSIALTIGALLILPTTSMASGGEKYRHKGCNSHACDKRVSKKQKIHRTHPMCNTWKCVKRVNKARYKRFVKNMKQTIQPYTGWLYSTRMCESGGNYWTNTGNGFYGAYQFTLSSWRAVSGVGYPHQASKLEQDYRAVKLLGLQGRGAWPNCG